MHIDEFESYEQFDINLSDCFHKAKVLWGNDTAYEQSLFYLAQACRRGGWVVHSTSGWLVVAKHYAGHRKHVAICPMAADLIRFIPEAMRELMREGVAVSFVKHVPLNQALSLIDKKHFKALKHPRGANGTAIDDYSEDRLPQIVVRLEELNWIKNADDLEGQVPILPSGSCMNDFRWQLRRFGRMIRRGNFALAKKDLHDATDDEIESTTNNWLQSIQSRFRKQGRPPVRDYCQVFAEPVNAMLHFARLKRFQSVGEVILVDGIPRASWCGAVVSDTTLAIYVLIADTSLRGLSDFTLYKAMFAAVESGSLYMNLGGSELESLHYFKNKANPRRSKPPMGSRVVMDLVPISESTV